MSKSSFKLMWSTFKAQIALRDLYIQWVDERDTYYIWAPVGPWHLVCVIAKDGNADQLDFEANYKDLPSTNRNPVMRTQAALGEDDFTINFRGVPPIACPGNQTTQYDFQFDAAYAIQGGSFCSWGGQPGDRFSLQIVDVDDILGMGANTVLAQYVTDACAVPNIPLVVEDVSVGFLPAPGLYARIIYQNTGANAATVLLNLKLFNVL